MEEVRRLSALEGQEINEAKKVLAYECTKLVHGEEEAQKAQQAASALFGGGADSSDIPSFGVSRDQLAADGRAAIRFTRRMLWHPRSLMNRIAAEALPPVASMGSTTNSSRWSASTGSLQ